MNNYMVEISKMLFAFENQEINTLEIIHTMFKKNDLLLPPKFKDNFIRQSHKRIIDTYEGFAQMFSMQEENVDDCIVSNVQSDNRGNDKSDDVAINSDVDLKCEEKVTNDIPTVDVNNKPVTHRVEVKIELDDLVVVRDIMTTAERCNQHVSRMAKKVSSQSNNVIEIDDSDDERDTVDVAKSSNHSSGGNTTNPIKSESSAPIKCESIKMLDEPNRIFILLDSDEDHDVKESKPRVDGNDQNNGDASSDSERDKNEVNEIDEYKNKTTPELTKNKSITKNSSKKRKREESSTNFPGKRGCFRSKLANWSSTTKDVQCQQCDRVYTNNANLIRHIRTHTGEKPYKCEYCLKSFSRPDHLKNHMIAHAKEFPFSCSRCFLGVSSKAEKDKHEKSCTTKGYKCDQCDYVTLKTAHIKRHMQNKIHFSKE